MLMVVLFCLTCFNFWLVCCLCVSFVLGFCVINRFIISNLAGTFYVIYRCISMFMSVWDTTSNFVYNYSLASLISRLSGVFVVHEEDHVLCRKRLELK